MDSAVDSGSDLPFDPQREVRFAVVMWGGVPLAIDRTQSLTGLAAFVRQEARTRDKKVKIQKITG